MVKVCIIGDLMLDRYTFGTVERISPEAPVPVLHAQKETTLPGGAGNVIANLLALETEVIALGRVGDDNTGEEVCTSLLPKCDGRSAFFTQEGYCTPLKNRLLAHGQQLLRIDREDHTCLTDEVELKLIAALENAIEEIDLITISDYGKGCITPSLSREVIRLARSKNIPVLVDPKGKDFAHYSGATLIKPNLGEAYEAAHQEKAAALEEVYQSLQEVCPSNYLLITRSDKGSVLFNNEGKRVDFPVHSKEVVDVTGAGDTVLAVLAFAIANNYGMEYAIQLSNVAAGIAVQKVGCATVTLEELQLQAVDALF